MFLLEKGTECKMATISCKVITFEHARAIEVLNYTIYIT